MIRSNGGAAPNHHSPPPPPLLHSSSWSSLSPLAPPFTVDRPLTPTEGSDWSSSVSNTSTAFSVFRSMASSRVDETSPFYYAGGGLQPLVESEGCAIPWNGPFDGDVEGRGGVGDVRSSWADPSSIFDASAFQKGTAREGFVGNEDSWGPWHGKLVGSSARKYHFGSECSDWLDDHNHEKNVKTPCNTSGMSVFGTSALHKGTPYFPSLDRPTSMEQHNAYNSNASYDSYITQLVSCSRDDMVYYPDTYSSVEAYAASARRNTEYLWDKRKELSINQNAEIKGQNERSIASSNLETNNINFVGSYLMTKNCLLGSDYPTKVKSGLRIEHLDLPDPFPYVCDSVKAADLVLSPSETLDQLNHGVDSPCWKGAQLSRHYPFGVGEEIDPSPLVKELKAYPHLLVKQSKGFDDLDIPEQDESLICTTTSDNSHLPPLREFSPVVSSPSRDTKLQDGEKVSNYSKVGNEKEGQYSHALGGQSTEALAHRKGDSNLEECGVKPKAGETNLATGLEAVSQEAVPVNILEPLHASDPAGYYSPPVKNSQVLLQAMHSLSEMLLSMSYGDTDELKEHDQDAVQQVIDNLKTLILKSKKDNSLPSGLVTGQSQVTASKADIGPCMCNDKSDLSLPKGLVKDFGGSTGMTQALKKGLEESLHEKDEENPRTLLYKNLWIEAEAALCASKYARLKLELENQKNQTTANSCDLSSKKINTVGKPQEANTGKASDPDASFMARFSVLKSRDEKSSTATIEGQEKLDVGSSQPEIRNNSEEIGRFEIPNQAYFTNGKGKHFLQGGCDSSSSEWEHVFEEEFTCYNSP